MLFEEHHPAWAARRAGRPVRTALVGSTLCWSLGAVQAQSAVAEDVQALPTVTVSASKRAQANDTVPATVDVVPAQRVQDRGITALENAFASVPNVGFSNAGVRGYSFLSIRGIGNNLTTIDPAVAVYVDGVPLGDFNSYALKLFDIERIEVLKGPQGSLYGVNSQAGVVNVVSRAPDANRRASASLDIGSFGRRDLNLAAAGPLVEGPYGLYGLYGLYGSIALSTDRSTGSIRNAADGQRYPQTDGQAARGRLRWVPSDRWEFGLSFLRQQTDDVGNVRLVPVNRDSYNANPLVGAPIAGPFETSVDTPGGGYTRQNATAVTAQYFGDGFDIAALLNRRAETSGSSYDFDGTSTPLFSAGIRALRIDEANAELRVQSPQRASPDFDWLIGVSRNRIDRDWSDISLTALPGNPVFPVGSYDLLGAPKLNVSTAGLFGQTTSRWLRGRLGTTFGGRWERSEREVSRGAGAFGSPALSGSSSETGFMPKFAVDYRAAPRSLLYASVSTGIKSGGLNPYATSLATAPYKKERATAFELGYKASPMPTVDLQVAAFLTRLRDYQDTQYVNGLTVNLGNAEQASTRGVDATLAWRVAPGWTVDAVAGIVDARYDQYLYNAETGRRLDGLRIGLIPRHNASLAATWRQGAGWFARAEVVGAGAFNIYAYDAATDSLRTSRISGWAIGNLRLGWEQPRWQAYAYVNDIANSRYFTYADPELSGSGYADPVGVTGPQRSLGVQFKVAL